MKVYHGTSEKYLDDILANGLIPRGERPGNWEHTEDSHPEMVYLTSVYAGYFALATIEDFKKERMAIVEVNLDVLPVRNFRPDEDFIAQALQLTKQVPESMPLIELNKIIKQEEKKYKHLWKDSLEHMGTMAYKGSVPVSAITQISLVKLSPFISLE